MIWYREHVSLMLDPEVKSAEVLYCRDLGKVGQS